MPEAAPRRSAAPLAFIGLLVVSALVYSLGPSGVLRPPPPVPAGEAPALPELAALHDAQARVDAAWGWAVPGEERDPSVVFLRPLPEPSRPAGLREDLVAAAEATRAWIQAVQATGPDPWAPPGRAARFRRYVTGGSLYAYATGWYSRQLLETVAARAERERYREAVASHQVGPAGPVFQAHLNGGGLGGVRPGALIAALRAEPPAPLRPSLGIALDVMMLADDTSKRISCDERAEAADFRSDFYRASPAGFSLRERWRRRLRAMALEVQLDRLCQPPNPKRRESHFGSYLDEIEARGSQVPDLVGRALRDTDAAIGREHDTWKPPSPWLTRARDRVQALATRFPAP